MSYYEIYVNGTLMETGDWNSSTITYDLSGLIPGSYNITMVAYDETGSQVSDSVGVRISQAMDPAIMDFAFIQIISLVAIGLLAYMGFRIIKSGTKHKEESDWRDMLDDFGR